MPILAAEPECYPLSLFDDHPPEPTPKSQWFVAQTKPRQEKCLARRLHAVQIAHYLPAVAKRRIHRGRIRTSRIPLFPGYLFFRADHHDRVKALTSNRIVRCLEVPDQADFWHDMVQVHRLIATGLPITPEARIAVGSPVEITSGPLAGLQGVVERVATGHRFYVMIDFIEKGASVLIDDFALAPIAPAWNRWPKVAHRITERTTG